MEGWKNRRRRDLGKRKREGVENGRRGSRDADDVRARRVQARDPAAGLKTVSGHVCIRFRARRARRPLRLRNMGEERDSSCRAGACVEKIPKAWNG